MLLVAVKFPMVLLLGSAVVCSPIEACSLLIVVTFVVEIIGRVDLFPFGIVLSLLSRVPSLSESRLLTDS